MAELSLNVSTEEMRTVANVVESLVNSFTSEAEALGKYVVERLMEEDCKGPTADAFKEKYLTVVDAAFKKETERLLEIVKTLRLAADGFDGANDRTVNKINSSL